MEKIGNIVTRNKKGVFADIFNVVETFDEAIEGIPTLIIGLEDARKCIKGFNILEKQYDNVWWTFKKTERRYEYEEDIINFYNYAIIHEMEKVRYVYVDLVTYTLTNIKKMIRFLGDRAMKKYVFLTKNSNFMFVYSKQYNTVFGISLELCEYIGIPKQKIYKLFRNQEYIHGTNFMGNEIRGVIGSNTHYILPLYTYLH